ncbi:MAG TPA: hypothetical protein VK085_14130 [Pseudogracilibacillus sp.]|nr:hypothetical protein [Pseudogracilibacillus sp.]
MDGVNTEWLPHLTSEVVSETEGNYLDAYVVALEGWRRGLTLRWHVKDSEKFKEMKTWFVDQPGQLFSLHSNNKDHYFFRTRGDKVTNEAVEKGMNKEATKSILSKAGIPVPEGKQFTREDSEQAIIEYADKLGYPVVIKPTDGSFGRGVMSDISSEGELKFALEYLRNELEENEIIVEKYIPGNDYRLYIVGADVVGAIWRVPPNIVGDGINSIKALIDIKNSERKLNPRLANCPIKIDQETIDYIRRSGYTLESVPEKDEVIYTNDKGNVSIGGDPIDVLDELSDEVKETAVAALQAIPGLTHGAVDLIIAKDESGKEAGYVIELNPTAQIGGILFPFKGQPRDVPKAIIDYYFPETKNVGIEKKKIYFDFNKTLTPLIENVSVVTELVNYPIGKIVGKELNITNLDHTIHNILWLKNKALQYNLNGSVRVSSDERIRIIIVGDQQLINKFGVELNEKFMENNITIEETVWNKPVKIGFQAENIKKYLIDELDYLTEYKNQLHHQQRILEKEYYTMLNSISWKITLPLRKITGKIKDFYRLTFKGRQHTNF